MATAAGSEKYSKHSCFDWLIFTQTPVMTGAGRNWVFNSRMKLCKKIDVSVWLHSEQREVKTGKGKRENYQGGQKR